MDMDAAFQRKGLYLTTECKIIWPIHSQDDYETRQNKIIRDHNQLFETLLNKKLLASFQLKRLRVKNFRGTSP